MSKPRAIAAKPSPATPASKSTSTVWSMATTAHARSAQALRSPTPGSSVAAKRRTQNAKAPAASVKKKAAATRSLVKTAHCGTKVVTTSKNLSLPAFLNKLYSMLNDPETDDLIQWAADGQSFFVNRPEDFAKEVLPSFFKHGNFSSFVRQLNMYGFHKIPHIQQGSLHADAETSRWEFSNPNFQRDRPDLLALVSRKRNRDGDERDNDTPDLQQLLQDIAAIRKHQLAITTDLKTLQESYRVLWQEAMTAESRHKEHQGIIDSVLRFLAMLFANQKRKSQLTPRKRQLLIEDVPGLLDSPRMASDQRTAPLTEAPPSPTPAPSVSPLDAKHTPNSWSERVSSSNSSHNPSSTTGSSALASYLDSMTNQIFLDRFSQYLTPSDDGRSSDVYKSPVGHRLTYPEHPASELGPSTNAPSHLPTSTSTPPPVPNPADLLAHLPVPVLADADQHQELSFASSHPATATRSDTLAALDGLGFSPAHGDGLHLTPAELMGLTAIAADPPTDFDQLMDASQHLGATTQSAQDLTQAINNFQTDLESLTRTWDFHAKGSELDPNVLTIDDVIDPDQSLSELLTQQSSPS
ncbi:Heat shock transcription factor [Dimargaris verticillata]|uniref:Heat shock transcription factor n=1 Tax=Dimargaris verticillata TaxID=2761393 RepID=A0A9W8B3M4_9FUNG|nr:Heat shock transcription factor [Dimargaris verticillata]